MPQKNVFYLMRDLGKGQYKQLFKVTLHLNIVYDKYVIKVSKNIEGIEDNLILLDDKKQLIAKVNSNKVIPIEECAYEKSHSKWSHMGTISGINYYLTDITLYCDPIELEDENGLWFPHPSR